MTEKIVELSEEEVIAEVDTAVGQLLNPLKMKCHLVNQLKTQITDLEMFIEFLQSETTEANGGGLDAAADCGYAFTYDMTLFYDREGTTGRQLGISWECTFMSGRDIISVRTPDPSPYNVSHPLESRDSVCLLSEQQGYAKRCLLFPKRLDISEQVTYFTGTKYLKYVILSENGFDI